MNAWFARLFAPTLRPAAALVGARVAHSAEQPAAPKPASATDALDAHLGLELGLLVWLADGRPFAVGPAGQRERALLRQLDALIADTAAHERLLPRAAAVVPPLLARLRSPTLALPDLVEQVSRDVNLAAEVLRCANSARYRRDVAVVELEHAIRLLGVEGLRSAIARAVLKPLIGQRGSQSSAAAARLWDHSERKSQLCALLAPGCGIDTFAGCLAGLAHNAVWPALLRALEPPAGSAPCQLSPAFALALATRRDRLFAIVAREWQLDDLLAAPMASRALRLLADGERLAWSLCMPDRARASGLADALLRNAAAPVRAGYAALASVA
jgi:HD-like signal output (HDOD) protein